MRRAPGGPLPLAFGAPLPAPACRVTYTQPTNARPRAAARGPSPGRPCAQVYLHHLVHNYDELANWTVFTQAEPFVHSPDFISLITRPDAWRAPIQPLTYRAHPRWGPPELASEAFADEFLLDGAGRVFVEPADAWLAPTRWHNGWADPARWRATLDAGVFAGMWDRLRLPPPAPAPPYSIFYSAQFAVTRDAVRRWPADVYAKLLGFLLDARGEYADIGEDRKARACLMEFMWHTLFRGF